jgi:hypothetical protein
MPNTMSREDAICACDNILDLVECMDDRLPDQYATSVADRTRDMRKFIKDEWRSDNITEKMDGYLRNTWAGLRKWDRQNEHNDDLFYGLGEARAEVEDADAAGETKAGVTRAKQDRETEEGKAAHAQLQAETEAALSGLTPEQRKTLEAMTPRPAATFDTPAVSSKDRVTLSSGKPGPSPAELENPRPSPGTTNEMMQKAHTDGMEDCARRLLTELSRHRENLNSTCLDIFGSKGIEVVTKADIKHGDVLRVSKKTSSVRTQQLIEAAYLAGRIAGHYALSEEMKSELRKVIE